MVKRYADPLDESARDLVYADPEGEFVRFEDYERLRAQLDQIMYLLRANPNAYAYDILETVEGERVAE
jgi:hypothetical protein